jgi:hypothetical protein
MSLAINGDGPWCGTPPGPRPHFDVATSTLSRLEQLMLNPQPLPPRSAVGEFAGSRMSGGDDPPQCGNGLIDLLKHFPPPPPPSLGDLVGGACHQVLNALTR